MENSCSTCGKSKANLTCGCCGGVVCKNCAQFIDADRFSFFLEVPSELSHTTYCGSCSDSVLSSKMAEYDDLIERAKGVLVFTKSQTKETRLVKTPEKPVKVEGSTDRDETILRLAFVAAQKGYNALIEVDLKSEKIKDGSYQTTKWMGSGIPANIKGRLSWSD